MGVHKKSKYILKCLDTSDNPVWKIYEVATYRDMIEILKKNHNKTMTKNIL